MGRAERPNMAGRTVRSAARPATRLRHVGRGRSRAGDGYVQFERRAFSPVLRRVERGSGSAAGQRAVVRVTNSAAATVTAVTTATDGHAPMRLARGCEPPIAATYTALRLAAAAGPDARYQSRAHQAPAAANSAPPRSRRPVRRATRNPPARPRAATAEDRDVGVPLTGFTLSAGARRTVPLWPARFGLTGCRPSPPPGAAPPGIPARTSARPRAGGSVACVPRAGPVSGGLDTARTTPEPLAFVLAAWSQACSNSSWVISIAAS